MKEKRQYERYSVDFMNIHGKILFASNVKVHNISVGGIAFCSDKRLKIGGSYVLRLESKGTALHLRGNIIWTKLNQATHKHRDIIQTYTVGMKFSHVSATREKEIRQFIQDNFIDYQKGEAFSPVMSGLRIHVRFLIRDPEKAIINCAEDYRVTRISESGMLIESLDRMSVEDMFPMEIKLAENKPITLWGKIVTCTEIQETAPPCYEIGIEYIDMSGKDREHLKAFINSIDKKQ
jgi:c-di-GMP-binding flagellar brake protein YcgR